MEQQAFSTQDRNKTKTYEQNKKQRTWLNTPLYELECKVFHKDIRLLECSRTVVSSYHSGGVDLTVWPGFGLQVISRSSAFVLPENLSCLCTIAWISSWLLLRETKSQWFCVAVFPLCSASPRLLQNDLLFLAGFEALNLPRFSCVIYQPDIGGFYYDSAYKIWFCKVRDGSKRNSKPLWHVDASKCLWTAQRYIAPE